MEIDFSVLPKILFLSVFFLFLYFLAYKKILYSFVDPLFFWVITTSFSSVLVLEVLTDFENVAHFFLSQAFLCAGMHFSREKFDNVIKLNKTRKTVNNFTGLSLLIVITYVLFFMYVLSNLFVGYVKGFAFFSDTPTESKIANFRNGFGIFRKISWSAGTFVSTSFIFLLLTRKAKVDIVCLLVVIMFSSLEGSKSAIIQIAVSAGIVIYHPYFANKRSQISSFNKYLPFVAIMAMIVFFAVLSKENDSSDEVAFAFVRRLLYSADSILYYYLPVNINYFEKYNLFDFIQRIINPLLGFLRLQPYMDAPGNIMVENIKAGNSLDSVTVGPNTPFYIEGRIYFNYWASFMYCFFLGYLFFYIRQKFFSLKTSNAFFFVFFASFVHFASSLIIDINLAITQLLDLLFFVLPFYFIISLIVDKKVVLIVPIRWKRFFLTPHR